MLYWRTNIQAINPLTGKLALFDGPNVPGITQEDAERYCQKNELGYCTVVGCLVSEINDHPGPEKLDWSTAVDYTSRFN